MEVRFQNSPTETSQMTTAQLRSNFLVEELMVSDKVNLVYSHYDRAVIGGAKPVHEALALVADEELKAAYFLERRELGIINVGGPGTVTADGTGYSLSKLECLYVGKGVQKVVFTSDNPESPATYFLFSTPAHQSYPTIKYTKEQAAPVTLGEQMTSNRRTIYKYIHADGIKSCQLVMGLTVLNEGSVWNSVPPHTHTRRMECYFYFDVPDQHRVFHFMGQPQETRHVVMQNHEAVISAPWSMHYGCGTSHYGFIWAMAGENQAFSDMDPVPVTEIR